MKKKIKDMVDLAKVFMELGNEPLFSLMLAEDILNNKRDDSWMVLKARVVRTKFKKYRVEGKLEGRYIPLGETQQDDSYKILEWNTEGEAIRYIENHKALTLR